MASKRSRNDSAVSALSDCATTPASEELDQRRDNELHQISRQRKQLEAEIKALTATKTFNENLERILANDAKALQQAEENNPIALETRMQALEACFEDVRGNAKEAWEKRCKLKDEYGMRKQLVDRARYFMDQLDRACEDNFWLEKKMLRLKEQQEAVDQDAARS